MKFWTVAVCFCWLFIGTGVPADAGSQEGDFYRAGNFKLHGDDPHYLDLGAGAFDINGRTSAAGRVELRVGNKIYFLGPVLGILANTDGGVFGYGGVYADLSYQNVILTPLLSVGGYHQGDGKDLGGILEFRSALTLSYQFDNRVRIGLQADHISNADLHDVNPGAESLILAVGLPF